MAAEMTPPLTYGPWTLTDEVLCDVNGTRIVGTTKPHWVIKIRKHSTTVEDELAAYLIIRRHAIYGAITTPRTLRECFGVTDTELWYAMRRYRGHVIVDDHHRGQWKRVARDVLGFLRMLHTFARLVHMDIKTTNIYERLEEDSGGYVVGDYDLATCVGTTPCRCLSADMKYYLLSFGAELNQPAHSWRMDLTALGYTLAYLTWDPDNKQPTFRDRIYARRDGKATVEEVGTDEELVELREAEMARAHPLVRDYLDHLKSLPWDQQYPPSIEFYRELMRLFL